MKLKMRLKDHATLNLKKTNDNKDGVDKPEIITVARDIEPMKKAIKAWTDAYNELNKNPIKISPSTPKLKR